jgi:16S rRNA G1207 methylase RsmC
MTAEGRRLSLSDRFNRSHTARLQNATLERLYRTAYRTAYRKDYPAEAQPNAFVSRTTLQRLVGALHVGPGHTVVDLGCGHGDPGLWVARRQ